MDEDAVARPAARRSRSRRRRGATATRARASTSIPWPGAARERRGSASPTPTLRARASRSTPRASPSTCRRTGSTTLASNLAEPRRTACTISAIEHEHLRRGGSRLGGVLFHYRPPPVRPPSARPLPGGRPDGGGRARLVVEGPLAGGRHQLLQFRTACAHRFAHLAHGLAGAHGALSPDISPLLIRCKFFEPPFLQAPEPAQASARARGSPAAAWAARRRVPSSTQGTHALRTNVEHIRRHAARRGSTKRHPLQQPPVRGRRPDRRAPRSPLSCSRIMRGIAAAAAADPDSRPRPSSASSP